MKTPALILAVLVLFTANRLSGAIIQSNYSYQSTVTSDVNGPLNLVAELNYDDSGLNAPIAVVMHAYSGATGAPQVRDQAQRLRDNGFFVVSVSMRGRGGSDGIRDSGGVEIHDIYDAVEAVKADPQFASLIDATNVHITGYSGGGGNTMSALTKFPDYFRVGAAFFGMADYGYDLSNGWYNDGAGSRTSQLNTDIGNPNTGGNPILDRYLARASNLASKNNPYSEIHLFVNSNETICPPWNDSSFQANAVAAESFSGEFDNITVHIGGSGIYEDFNNNSINDADELQSWPHGFPTANQQEAGELWYRDRLLSGAIPQPVLNDDDTVRVAGYVKTSKFGLWLGDGQNAAADLTYSLSSTLKTFSFQIASSDTAVTGDLTVDTTDMTGRQVSVELDNVAVDSFSGGGDYTYAGLGHNEVLELVDSGPAANNPPTLTAFSGPVDSTPVDTEVEITFAELAAAGDETDSDGTVDAFVVQTVSTGTLKLGADVGSAISYSASTNDTIDATTNAYWTPATGATGSALHAFTLVARDDDLALSSPAAQATVEVIAPLDSGGLLAYYDFEDVTLDASGNGNHGTNNGVTFSTDVASSLSHSTKSGSFAGNATSGTHVDLGDLGLYNLAHSGGLTVSLWVKGSSQTGWVFGEGDDSDGDTAYVFGGHTGIGSSNDFVGFVRNATSTPNTLRDSTTVVFDNTWHHIVFADNAGTASVYIDGVLDAKSFNYAPITDTLDNTAIGAWLKQGAAAYGFTGLIDDVAIYSRVIEASDVALLAAGADPLSDANTFSRWISGFDVGELDGFDEDADADGIDNGIENFFGTLPNEFSQGLGSGTRSGNTFTFTHPVNDTPANDITAAYTWSSDLEGFHADGVTAGGLQVDFSAVIDSGIATVAATVTGSTDQLFVRVEVTKN